MITLTPLSSRAVEVLVDGEITPEDVARIFGELDGFLKTTDKIDIYAEIRNADFGIAAIFEEFKHFSIVMKLIRSIGRVAIVCDEAWIRGAAKLEGMLIPGAHYEVYALAEATHARDWLLRHTDVAHAA